MGSSSIFISGYINFMSKILITKTRKDESTKFVFSFFANSRFRVQFIFFRYGSQGIVGWAFVGRGEVPLQA